MEAIYAVDEKNGLAKNGAIPWHCKKDLQFFRNKTKRNVIIMGKNTFFSLPNGYLKDRLNIVLTSNPDDSVFTTSKNNPYVVVTNNDSIHTLIMQERSVWKNAYSYLSEYFTIFCIGGKKIYEQFVPICHKVWMTEIKKNYDCDLFFHFDYSHQFTKEIVEEDDELRIIKYERKTM